MHVAALIALLVPTLISAISHIGPICNSNDYITCHELALTSHNSICSAENSFCKCYYVNVLVNHCTRYCIQGINENTIMRLSNICGFNLNHRHSHMDTTSGLIFDYGIVHNVDTDTHIAELVADLPNTGDGGGSSSGGGGGDSEQFVRGALSTTRERIGRDLNGTGAICVPALTAIITSAIIWSLISN